MAPSLDELRRFALRRSLFAPTTLEGAIERLGFVQADPIRAPARAQDLSLMQRVRGYRAGDLEARYAELEIEEDFFINYGFLSRACHALMHPRSVLERYPRARERQAQRILEFVREHGSAHPRDVERHLGSGTEKNYWGGLSKTTTRLLDGLHYRGLLRVTRREAGIRVYAPAHQYAEPRTADERANIDALIDVVVGKYAPLPAASLAYAVGRLRYAAPQWRGGLKAGLLRAKARLAHAEVGGSTWYWPASERIDSGRRARAPADEQVRLLSPFDPVVWDRRRFELFWGWPYRFEAYTPVARRKLGYYALPLFWDARAVGWANLSFTDGELDVKLGYTESKVSKAPAFRRALEAELARFERFLTARER
jgi:uncharacterized protein YcaQ